jgi:hypothetical protein
MRKSRKKPVLIAILIIIALSVANLFDEGLSDEAQALIERVDYQAESRAFIYLLGIGAAPNDDPMAVGESLLNEYRVLEALEENEGYGEIEYPRASRYLPLPEGELFCASSEEGCLTGLFNIAYDMEALEKKYSVLIARVNKQQAFGEFHTMTRPSINEPFPEYRYISRATRIWSLKAISLYRKGREGQALELLFGKLEVARKNLALQDQFPGKLAYAESISELLDVASIILDGKVGTIYVDLMPRLSLTEKGFDQVSAREFVMAYNTFLNVYQNRENSGMKNIPWTLFRRMFYKPNMTANAAEPNYSWMDRISKMSPKEFAQEVERGEKPETSTSRIRNYVGHAMLGVEAPKWGKYYVVRLMDLDTKIEMFNSVHYYGVEKDKVRNPYYEDEYSYPQGKGACFRGPFEEKPMLRCLQLKY